VTSRFVFLPQMDGAARGTGADARVVEVTGAFSEIMPDFGLT
jgi:hypothetical protein